MSETIGITPGVGILAIFQFVKYKSWYALAEYVDNAIDSYLKNREALESTQEGYRLLIDIDINIEENYIRITDNAAGISSGDLERALRMAVRPPVRTGLSEFGMGMKAASCWFSPKWYVETQALGEDVRRKIIFDVNQIVENETSELSTNPTPSHLGAHFTNIHLADVYSMPSHSAIAKIREHLSSIYRGFIREDKMMDRVVITVNAKQLKYKAPSVLVMHPYADKTAEAVEWRKELDFTCAGGQRVTGFAAIYPTAKTKEAGFALLRRGRVVEGSYDEPYRPAKIFGAPGSFYSQRIYGELHLDDFTASFTKDGVQWEHAEEDFLARLKTAMKAPGIDLLKQANGMRVKDSSAGRADNCQNGGSDGGEGKGSAQPRSNGNSSNGGGTKGSQDGSAVLGGQDGNTGGNTKSNTQGANIGSNGEQTVSGGNTQEPIMPKPIEVRTLAATIDGISWRIYIELSPNPAHTNWMSISKSCIPASAQVAANERQLGVRVSLTHPFTTKYCAAGQGQLEPLIRLGAAFALARTIAQEGSMPNSSVIMDYVNELLLKF